MKALTPLRCPKSPRKPRHRNLSASSCIRQSTAKTCLLEFSISSLFVDFFDCILAESKSFFSPLSPMSGRSEMKRSVCSSRGAFRFAGVIFAVVGAILAIFWPRIFEHILAGVGHGFASQSRRF